MAKKTDAPKKGREIRTTVSPGVLKQILRIREAHYAQEKKERVRYPDRSKLLDLTPADIKKHGFSDHDLPHLNSDDDSQLVVGKRPSKGGKGGKGGKKKGGSGKKLLDPNVAQAEVANALSAAGISKVTGTGDIVTIHWNLENCDERKVQWFAAVYKDIFACADFVNLVEVNQKAVAELEKITGLKGFCSPENSRGQAVGFLVNTKRFDVIGQPEIWNEIAQIQGIKDLRPGFKLKVKDKVTGITTNRVVFHLKSMVGGPKRTEPIRIQQFLEIAKRVGAPVAGCKPLVGDYKLLQIFKNKTLGRGLSDHGILFCTEKYPSGTKLVDGMWIFAGDWNCFVDKDHQVTQPITSIGFTLVYPIDTTSTQQMGGRLDAWFRDTSTGACNVPTSGPFADNATVTPKVVQ